MANKKFTPDSMGEKSTPQATPDVGNRPKYKENVTSAEKNSPESSRGRGNVQKIGKDGKGSDIAGNVMKSSPREKKTFFKKMPERERGKGTWGGGVSRP